MEHNGHSWCSRKLALSVFFTAEVIAFTACLISVLSPSWQWVGLERGRTEHHHGLWLDCKRDYSFDYGRDREYYETLYRRDLQGTPFDVFILPKLECVFKFDYYIDPEDLYDNNHDENRLQDDAYQHLFLGHKIAALAACGVGVLLAGASLLLGICSFCHRTFIAAATSLVSLAAMLSFAGIAAFFGWASNQDNSVIKQRDEQETYEQHLGWAFYFQLAGAVFHVLAASLGCFATSVAFSKGRAKLVRIDVVESGASQADLLSSAHTLNDAPFKRSFSAIYRVDSSSLQQWEKDYAKRVKQTQDAFVRTKSMPMLGKRQSMRKKRQGSQKRVSLADHRSSSNLFISSGCETGETTTGTTNTIESNASARSRRPPSIPTPQPPKQLKSALKTSDRRFASTYEINRGGTDSGNEPGLDTTYEYLPCDQPPRNQGVSSFLTGKSQKGVYDTVYDYDPAEMYLEPNSVAEARRSTSTLDSSFRGHLPGMPLASGSIQSIPIIPRGETVIDDVVRASTAITDPASDTDTRTRIREMQTIEELQRIERFKRSRPQPPPKPSMPSKPSEALLPPPSNKTTTFEVTQSPIPPRTPDPKKKPILGPRDLGIPPSTSNGYGYCSSVMSDNSPPRELTLNTFGDHRGSTRSLTSLKFRPGFESGGSAAEIFERPDSSVEPTLPSASPASSVGSLKQAIRPVNLHRKLLLGTLPDEVDRSVGSSTILENETLRESNSSPLSYARDAELRLNLFLSDPVISSLSQSSSPFIRPSTRSDSDNNETTV